MSNGLLKLKEYGLFTFISTAQALKAERVLKDQGMDHLMIPTPREISTSCGLSIKVLPQNRERCRMLLEVNQVTWERIYNISRQGIELLVDGSETNNG